MKKMILVLSCLTYFSSYAQVSYEDFDNNKLKLLFQEDFHDNSGWTPKGEHFRLKVKDGIAELKSKGYPYRVAYFNESIQLPENWQTEIFLKIVKGSNTVLYINNSKIKNPKERNLIRIQKNGLLSLLGSNYDEKWAKLSGNLTQSGMSIFTDMDPEKGISVFKDVDFNKITIRRYQETTYVFINEVFVGYTENFEMPKAGFIGIESGGNSGITEFDWIKIWELENL
ncbi:MAG: hypothetical protein AAFX87_27110 [Bacteroidota bacterium]